MTDITGTNKERYDKTIRRREKLAGYYFDMSKLIFAATILTNVDIFKGVAKTEDAIVVSIGVLSTIFFAHFGNKVLKF